VRPGDEAAGGLRAEPVRFGDDAHSSEVETVGDPASLQRGVALCVAVGVQPADLKEELEAAVIEVHQPLRFDRARSTPRPCCADGDVKVALSLFGLPTNSVACGRQTETLTGEAPACSCKSRAWVGWQVNRMTWRSFANAPIA
jgi:hypothetical protein